MRGPRQPILVRAKPNYRPPSPEHHKAPAKGEYAPPCGAKRPFKLSEHTTRPDVQPRQPEVSSDPAPLDDGSSPPHAHTDSIDLSDLVLRVSSAMDKLESYGHTPGGHKLLPPARTPWLLSPCGLGHGHPRIPQNGRFRRYRGTGLRSAGDRRPAAARVAADRARPVPLRRPPLCCRCACRRHRVPRTPPSEGPLEPFLSFSNEGPCPPPTPSRLSFCV